MKYLCLLSLFIFLRGPRILGVENVNIIGIWNLDETEQVKWLRDNKSELSSASDGEIKKWMKSKLDWVLEITNTQFINHLHLTPSSNDETIYKYNVSISNEGHGHYKVTIPREVFQEDKTVTFDINGSKSILAITGKDGETVKTFFLRKTGKQ